MAKRQQLAKTPNAEQYLASLKNHTNSNESEWCSQYYKNFSAYEYHHENLAEELKRRRRIPGNDVTEKVINRISDFWFRLLRVAGVL
jgi:hypothetical protein